MSETKLLISNVLTEEELQETIRIYRKDGLTAVRAYHNQEPIASKCTAHGIEPREFSKRFVYALAFALIEYPQRNPKAPPGAARAVRREGETQDPTG